MFEHPKTGLKLLKTYLFICLHFRSGDRVHQRPERPADLKMNHQFLGCHDHKLDASGKHLCLAVKRTVYQMIDVYMYYSKHLQV